MLHDERTTVVRHTINVVRALYEICIRETIVRLYHECLATIVRLSYYSRATVVRLFLLKWFMLISINNMFIARQSHNSHKTVIRQKNRRAKKLHIQCSSHHKQRRYDPQNIVRLS